MRAILTYHSVDGSGSAISIEESTRPPGDSISSTMQSAPSLRAPSMLRTTYAASAGSISPSNWIRVIRSKRRSSGGGAAAHGRGARRPRPRIRTRSANTIASSA